MDLYPRDKRKEKKEKNDTSCCWGDEAGINPIRHPEVSARDMAALSPNVRVGPSSPTLRHLD